MKLCYRVGAGVGNMIGGALDGSKLGSALGSEGIRAVSGMAGGIAGAAAASLVSGRDFGDTLMTTLPSIIGNTIGSLVGDAVAGRGSPQLGYEDPGSDDSVTTGGAVLSGVGAAAMPRLGAGGGQVGTVASSDDAQPGDIVVIARKPGYDGLSAAIAQAAFVTSEARRAGAGAPVPGVSLQGRSSTITSLSLTKNQYLDAIKNDLWGQVQGDPNSATGFSNNAEVNTAAKKTQALPSVSTADLQASSDLAAFVKDIGSATAGARIGGNRQNFEKFLTFGRNADGEIVVTAISVVGRQGGNIAGLLNSDVIGIAHVHYQGLVQPPNSGDNSIAKVRNLPSFVIGSTGRNVWEIGRANGSISIRSVLPNNNVGRWEPYQSDADRYRIYDGSKYP